MFVKDEDEDEDENDDDDEDDEDEDDEDEDNEDEDVVAGAEVHDGLSAVDASRHPPSSSSLDDEEGDDSKEDSSCISPLALADKGSDLLRFAEARASSEDAAAGEKDGKACCC